MARPQMFFVSLEDFGRISGQTARYRNYLPYLTQWIDVTLVGRRGALPEPFASLFAGRIELPLETEQALRRYVLDPRGPARLAALRRALGRLRSTPETILYADSALLAEMALRSPHRLLAAEINGAIGEEFRHKSPRASRILGGALRRWESRAYGRCDRLIAISGGVEAYIRALAPAAEGRITVLGNGIDPGRFNPQADGTAVRRERGWGGAPVGIFVSAFRPWHGIHKLIEALPHVLKARPEFRLALVGDGPEHGRIARLVAERRLEASVDMPGAIEPDAVAGWIAASDIGLYYPDYSSPYGFLFDSIKFHEYMACGKPSVTIRMRHLGDPVAEAEAGVFTEPTPEAFARGVLELLADPARREAMGRRGAELALRQHTWSSVARGIARVCGVEPR